MTKKVPDMLGLDDFEDDDEPQQRVGARITANEEVLAEILRGVSIRWLQVVFKRDRATISKLIRGVRPLRVSKGGHAFYSVKEVAPYIVKAKMDIATYLENLDPDDLPERLRESYWKVQERSQKVRVAAGELWRTTDVIEVLGETFKGIKNAIMLWTDTVEEQVGLTDEQRAIIIALADSLQEEIHKTVIARASRSNQTRSQLAEIEPVTDDEDDSYYADL